MRIKFIDLTCCKCGHRRVIYTDTQQQNHKCECGHKMAAL